MQLYKRLRQEYEHGLGTISGVARKYKVHRRTVRAALKSAVPPKRKVSPRERPKMALAIPFIDAILENDLKVIFSQRHTAHQIWGRIQVEMPECDVGESTVRAYVRGRKAEMDGAERQTSQATASWMMEVLHSDVPLRVIEKEFPDGAAASNLEGLIRLIKGDRLRDRKKALAVLGCLRGIRAAVIARCLQMSRRTVGRYFSRFANGGINALLPTKAAKPKDDPERGQFLFSLLHSPPSAHGINRTSWRMDDLHRIMAESGHRTSKKRIRTLIKTAGFKWRKAKVVLTSNDPEYHTKVEAIKKILSALKEDEAFFSIDEYGPFAIKRKGGIKRVGPGENYLVPQYQKSKGWLILTAALELSRNQITHFYSLKKNTEEMIKMADRLRAEYRTCRTIYLSWDAASWHISKKLFSHLDKINQQSIQDGFPIVKTAPLPACAQFLNVIESVFSGMAKGIIHNSDYPSVEAAKDAIDRYFRERNDSFVQCPKRAGRKIWGQERVPSEFSEANNCKDPLYCRLPEYRS
jgi:transposase